MPVAKKNINRTSQQKDLPPVVIVSKTQRAAKDFIFDKKMKVANEILSKTILPDGSPLKRKS